MKKNNNAILFDQDDDDDAENNKMRNNDSTENNKKMNNNDGSSNTTSDHCMAKECDEDDASCSRTANNERGIEMNTCIQECTLYEAGGQASKAPFSQNSFGNSSSDRFKRKSFNSAIDSAKKEIKGILSHTPMFSLTQDDIQIQYRNKLGQGAFCSVYPVCIKNHKTSSFHQDAKEFFVIKKLRMDAMKDASILLMAYEDLYQEAILMKKMQHDSIVTLFGMSNACQETDKDGTNVTKMQKEHFFIVMEKLQSTLDSKLEQWSNEILGYFTQITPPNIVKMQLESIAFGVASALNYLHSHKIVYRDIKPANIGFDVCGNVKLFDFGLAVHISSTNIEKSNNSGGSKIQGKAGTIRYMAPEMKQGKSYDYSVDVYSFGILLWQIVTTRIPFEKEIPTMDFFNADEELGSKDILEGVRPDLKYIENKSLSALLEICWHEDPNSRYTFAEIEPEIDRIFKEMKEDEKSQPKNELVSRLVIEEMFQNWQYFLVLLYALMVVVMDKNKSFLKYIKKKTSVTATKTTANESEKDTFIKEKEGETLEVV